ncbi:MAG TPA: hypothetical protein VFW49_08480 [Fluviicoccus sp.]|nr:hypothetical protein [Fluviicoccus sp.]
MKLIIGGNTIVVEIIAVLPETRQEKNDYISGLIKASSICRKIYFKYRCFLNSPHEYSAGKNAIGRMDFAVVMMIPVERIMNCPAHGNQSKTMKNSEIGVLLLRVGADCYAAYFRAGTDSALGEMSPRQY